MKLALSVILFTILVIIGKSAMAQDWSSEAELPGTKVCKEINSVEVCFADGDRSNIYSLELNELQVALEAGSGHALSYPVSSTGLRVPFRPLKNYFESESTSPLRKLIFRITKMFSPFKSLGELFAWMGLNEYPQNSDENGPNIIAEMGRLEEYRMGTTIGGDPHAEYLTFSCAGCHSADLFGKKIMGMTTRFPRANEAFIAGKKALGLLPTIVFSTMTGANRDETEIYAKAKEDIKHVGMKKPLNLGLDTSLAQVGLSLARRELDDYATKSRYFSRHPRKNQLETKPADSKPAVWWNLKYKTRWLSDGSILSGNPIYTNFLWNEIGRGIDLKNLEQWFKSNQNTIKDLTAYVFATKAPQYEHFFPGEIDIELAREGQKLFRQNCMACHGDYIKGWEEADHNNYADQLKTTKVWYHTSTPVINVGTDLNRAKGMNYFADDLNRLKISKTIGTVVKPQMGYVPPPLVGIWARWPYFHNNSAPSLYAVLTPDFKRPKFYIAAPAEDPELDFDKVKNGYPSAEKIREPYRSDREYFYDTTRTGMSNKGHTTRILLNNEGQEKFSHEDKLKIIEYLKTL